MAAYRGHAACKARWRPGKARSAAVAWMDLPVHVSRVARSAVEQLTHSAGSPNRPYREGSSGIGRLLSAPGRLLLYPPSALSDKRSPSLRRLRRSVPSSSGLAM